MNSSPLTIQDFYPLIHQTLLDTLRIDSMLLSFPYDDLEKLDMGLRKLFFGEYNKNQQMMFSLQEDMGYSIVVLESSLGFYNLVATVSTDEQPLAIALLPFRTEPITSVGLSKIMRQHGVAPRHFENIYRVYFGLPLVQIEDIVRTLQHLVGFVIPEFANCPVHQISFAGEVHEPMPSDERMEKFSADLLQTFAQNLNDCLRTMASGNSAQATDKMKTLLSASAILIVGDIDEVKEELECINYFMARELFNSPVHPYYTYQAMLQFKERIEGTTSMKALQHLPFDMVRKYALLAKNYSYDGYSYLVRDTVNYIDQHLEADLSLSALAELFGKNPSYLSASFKKETGETLTSYVAKQRAQAALRYFNTTKHSVSEVAQLVGIYDYAYFSKVFKKYVGVSPREYIKMLDKK